MLISTKFDMHQMVGIVGLNGRKGRIVRIAVLGNNVTYSVEYWADERLVGVDLWEDEISEGYSQTV